jgi:putative antitoxin of VapBC-like toxin-antitoxin system
MAMRLPLDLACDIATHINETISMAIMKTTLDIADPLLREARKLAAREGTTLRALVERGLRQVVAEKTRSKTFRLRKASFKGQGLRPELRDAEWERLRDIAYEGRGS